MEGSWAFNWVQGLRHKSQFVLLVTLMLLGLSCWGMTQISVQFMAPIFLAGAALVVMSLVSIYLLDSFKSALFIFWVSSFLLGLLVGIGLLIQETLGETQVFGWIVVLIMFMTNLTHIITTLHREMARGIHQFDAIAEAIRLNSQPIFLSNTTTLAGFLVVGWFDSVYLDLAMTILVGWGLIALILLILLPWVLMNWLLEFRVGHYQDRHGFLWIADFLQKKPFVAKALTVLGLLLSMVALGLMIVDNTHYQALLMMLVSSGLLLGFCWRSLKMTLAVLMVSGLVVLLAFAIFSATLQLDMHLAFMTLVIPLGIVLDDMIHFFSRIRRAKLGFYRDDVSAIRYTLSSIGRPIWNTSVLILSGLLVLLIGGNPWVFQLSSLTLIAIILITFTTLVLLPAFYISRSFE